jgi:AcrR family transcriptional regulator
VGLAPSAIYRHYPGKVDILAAACLQAAGLLAQAVDRSLDPAAGPRATVVALAAAYVAYSFEHNALTSVAEAEIAGLPAGLQRPLILAQRRIEDLLLTSALRVVTADPAVAAGSALAVELPERPVPRTRRAEILAAAIPLFARDGFANVTNAQIAEAVGLAPSAIYRHYPGKVDILVAACLQAAGLLAQAVDRSLRRAADPREAVVALAAAYVAYSFEHNALTSVAEAEVAGLPADLQRPVILAQREHIAVWEQQLRLARPELDPRQARLLVHAGFGVVVEAGRALRWQDTPGHRDAVTALVIGALIG